jgi:type IV secretory pathway VirB10-like protein
MKRVLTLALLLAALPASAVLYKWVDQDGKVHYSDQPPPDGAKKSGVVNAPAPNAPSTPAPSGDAAAPSAAKPDGEAANAAPKAPKTTAEQEMEFRKRRLEAAEAEAKRQQDAQAAEEKKRNCAQATNRLTALEAGGRLTKYGPPGETLYLSDAEISRELGEARKVADSWCK